MIEAPFPSPQVTFPEIFNGEADSLLVILAVLVVLLFQIGIGVTFWQPWVSSVVRARASYAPPALALPDERDEPIANMDQPTIVGMMRRAVRLRGWRAVYAGGMLTALGSTCSMVGGAVIGVFVATHPQYTTHVGLLSLAALVFVCVPDLLLRVLAVRAIVHPASPHTTWKELVPVGAVWHIYTLPGIWPAYLLIQLLSLQVGSVIFLAFGPTHRATSGGVFRLVLLLAALALIYAPFEVAFVRLASQELDLTASRAQPGAQPLSSPAQSAGAQQESQAELIVNPRSVLALPTQEGEIPRPDAYTGLVDCFRTLVKEEGYGALYRGAMFTFIALWCTALAHWGSLQ